MALKPLLQLQDATEREIIRGNLQSAHR